MDFTLHFTGKALGTGPLRGRLVQGEKNADTWTLTGPARYGGVALTDLLWTLQGTNRSYDSLVRDDLPAPALDAQGRCVLAYTFSERMLALPGPLTLELTGMDQTGTTVLKVQGDAPVEVLRSASDGITPPVNDFENALNTLTQLKDEATRQADDARQSAGAAADSQSAARASAEAAADSGAAAADSAAGAANSARSAAASADAAAASAEALVDHMKDETLHLTPEKTARWNTAAAKLEPGGVIDCGSFTGTETNPVSLHNATARSHTLLHLDGNVTQGGAGAATLQDHMVDPGAHGNLIVDGNVDGA